MAGNASNWHKPVIGHYKGQVVYVAKGKLTPGEQAQLAMARQQYGALPDTALITGLIGFGTIKPQARPLGVAQGSALATAVPRPGTTGTPTPHAQEMDMKAASNAFLSKPPNYTAEMGLRYLASVYAAQGYNAKPDVLTKADIDAYVAKGERELFRGTYGAGNDPDAHSEAFRSGAVHYAGNGMYGNGTYTGSYMDANAYAGGKGNGTIIRMTIKSDAKVGTYSGINSLRQAEHDAIVDSPRYARYENALLDLSRQKSTILLLPKTRSARIKADRDAKVAALDARYERVRARRDKEMPVAIYRDVGSYAAAKGYDAYAIRGTGVTRGTTYHVILNRGAVRVQDTSLDPL